MCVGSSIRGSSGLSTPLKGHESQMLGLPLLNSPNIRAITIRALGFAWARDQYLRLLREGHGANLRQLGRRLALLEPTPWSGARSLQRRWDTG